jgi:hypothetical protein
MTSNSYFKINIKLLETLNTKLHQEFYILDLKKLVSSHKDFQKSGDSIYINNFSKYSKEIKMLMALPNAKITNKWDHINEMWMEFDSKIYILEFNERIESRNNTIEKLKKMTEFYKNDPSDSFLMLYVKYEDTFVTLINTMKEIDDVSVLTEEQKQTIFQVIDTILQEFDSLMKVHQKMLDVGDIAIKESLTNRLKDELTLVNKIKTDWNGNK